jgi:hypothetical protein
VSLQDVLARIWADTVGTQPSPSATAVLVTGATALLLVALPPAWRVTRHVVTIAHEGAHGVAALLSGRKLAGIRLHSDTSGLTVSRGRPTGPGMVATAFAGYVGPGLLGLGAAYLLRERHALAVLWLVVLLLGLLLVQIRNFYGLYAVVLAGGAVLAVSWWGSGCSPWPPGPAPGSCCCRPRGRCSSCSASVGAGARGTPTRTCWRG